MYGACQVQQKAPAESTTSVWGVDNLMVSTCADKSTTGAMKTLSAASPAGVPTVGLMCLRDTPRTPRSLPASPEKSLVGKMAWEGVAGYTGHIPGKDAENIHGLTVQHSKEQGMAEHTAMRLGATNHPPWHLWATSNGKYPGYKPSWRTQRNTLDKVTKPHRIYCENFHGVGIGDAATESGKYQKAAAGCMGRVFANSIPRGAKQDLFPRFQASRRGPFFTTSVAGQTA